MLTTAKTTTNFSESFSRIVSLFGNLVPVANPTHSKIASAYKVFANSNPQWSDSLFDRHFLNNHGQEIVAAYLNGHTSRTQTAESLARAWEASVVPPTLKVTKQYRADVVMAADHFVACLPC